MLGFGAGNWLKRYRGQFELVFELLEELVLVDVLVEELVPELLLESVSVVQLPLEQLFDCELELLVDFETVTDLLPARMRPSLTERAVRSPGAGTIGAASATENAATVAKMLAAKANALRPAMTPCSFPAGHPEGAAIRAFEHGRAGCVNSPFGASAWASGDRRRLPGRKSARG